MAHSLLPLEDQPRTWCGYGLLLCLLSALCFGSLYGHPLDTHDQEIFADSRATGEDFSYFFLPADQKALGSGRPMSDLVRWLAYEAWGAAPGPFHLLSVAAHTLASFLLARLAWRLGMGLELSLVGGLLFLVNVAHFQAVHWIGAFDYPLALVLGLGAVHCYLSYLHQARPGWLGAFYLLLFLVAMTHLALLLVWPFCLHRSWQRQRNLKTLLGQVLPFGLVLLPSLAITSYLTASSTSTSQALGSYTFAQMPGILLGMGQLLLWLASRLLTTAHGLPLPVYQQQGWELVLGVGVLIGLGWLLWRREPLAAPWALWTLGMLVPFLLLTEKVVLDMPAGPSRYLYFASAGSSLVWAWGLLQLGKVGRWGRLLFLGGVGVLLGVSWVSLRQAEAISFYTSGRNYIANGQVDEGIAQLARAIRHAPQVIPLEEVYFRLACALPYLGEDPTPLLREALAQAPDSFLLGVAMAITQAENPDPQTREQGEGRLEQLRQQAQQTGRTGLLATNAAAIYRNLGKGHLRKGEALKAIGAFERALAFEPEPAPASQGLAQAWALRGIQLGEEGQEAQALAAYTRALDLNPAETAARVNLGWLHYRAGRWEEAIAQYQAALALGPNIHAQFNLGLALLAKGEGEAARTAYGRGVEEFSAAAAEQIGAVADLKMLVGSGRAAGPGGEILRQHWPAPH